VSKINRNLFKDIKKNKYFQLLPDFKEDKTQKVITLTLTLVALSFFGLFAINPTLSTIAKLEKELSDNKSVDQQLQTKINNLSILQQKYALLQEDLPYIYASIPKTPEAPTVIAQIQRLANENNLKIVSLQTFSAEIEKAPTNPKQYSNLIFNLSAEGTYSDIKSFITSFNSSQRIVNFDILSINKKGNENSLLILTLKGTTFFKK
jgi:Tfp pilus assembly protein PilO